MSANCNPQWMPKTSTYRPASVTSLGGYQEAKRPDRGRKFKKGDRVCVRSMKGSSNMHTNSKTQALTPQADTNNLASTHTNKQQARTQPQNNRQTNTQHRCKQADASTQTATRKTSTKPLTMHSETNQVNKLHDWPRPLVDKQGQRIHGFSFLAA